MPSPILLHLPHASKTIPDDLRHEILLSDRDLQDEINRLTDHATDLIFTKAFPRSDFVAFPISRLVVDPERFPNDSEEPMSAVGMGALYTHGSLRQLIRRTPDFEKREHLLKRFYEPHHHRLTTAVDRNLEKYGKCVIIDGHSFPTQALPYELNQAASRPDFCLGTDYFHTPEELVQIVEEELQQFGLSTTRDEPFSGTIVPTKHYHKDQRVQSLMIEINRGLYLREDYSIDSEKTKKLIRVLEHVEQMLKDR